MTYGLNLPGDPIEKIIQKYGQNTYFIAIEVLKKLYQQHSATPLLIELKKNPNLEAVLEFTQKYIIDTKPKGQDDVAPADRISKAEFEADKIIIRLNDKGKETVIELQKTSGDKAIEKMFEGLLYHMPEALKTKYQAQKLTSTYAAARDLTVLGTNVEIMKADMHKPGTLHTEFTDRLSHIDETAAERDRQILSQCSSDEVRSDMRLLVEGNVYMETDEELKTNFKEETAHRLKAYTSKVDDQWYEINYMAVGGSDHENGVGLGDILLDPDVEEILVDTGNEIFIAKRGIAMYPPKHAGRVGFVREDGEYVATHTYQKFRILSNTNPLMEQNYDEYLAQYALKLKGDGTDQKPGEIKQRVDYAEYARKYFANRMEYYDGTDVEKLFQKKEWIKSQLGFTTPINPPSENPEALGLPAAGIIRLIVAGDNNTSYGSSGGDSHLDQLAEYAKTIGAHFFIGSGDHMAAGGGGVTDAEYQKMLESIRPNFQKLFESMSMGGAIALGNHDYNPDGPTDSLHDLFRKKLKGYESTNPNEENPAAYSFLVGNATFVMFNRGQAAGKEELDFLSRVSAKAPGAVYLVSHVPPYQNGYGSGLGAAGNIHTWSAESLAQLKAIGQSIEARGKAFYILSGHTHFHEVIGNYVNIGGMQDHYWGDPNQKMRAAQSFVVIDMAQDGTIQNLYFRSAEGDLTKPLAQHELDMAWGNRERLLQDIPQAEIEEDRTPDGHYSLLKIDESRSAVEQIRQALSPSQLEMAKIIEEEFLAAGLPRKLAAGAIVNAYVESKLNPTKQSGCHSEVTGLREDSWGLFQVKVDARESDPERQAKLREKMKNPRENCREIIREILHSKKGAKLMAVVAKTDSITEIAGAFCRYIERPRDPELKQYGRGRVASSFYHHFETEAERAAYLAQQGIQAQPAQPSPLPAPQPAAQAQPTARPQPTPQPQTLDLPKTYNEIIDIFQTGTREQKDKLAKIYGFPTLAQAEQMFNSTSEGAWGESHEGLTMNRFETPPTSNLVTLTLDICSNYGPEKTSNVILAIDEIVRRQIPVILFVSANALKNPTIQAKIKEVSAYSFIHIGNHGCTHCAFATSTIDASGDGSKTSGINRKWRDRISSSLEELYDETVGGAIAVQALTGKRPDYIRAGTLWTSQKGAMVATTLTNSSLLNRTRHKGRGIDDAGASVSPDKAFQRMQSGDVFLGHAMNPRLVPSLRSIQRDNVGAFIVNGRREKLYLTIPEKSALRS